MTIPEPPIPSSLIDSLATHFDHIKVLLGIVRPTEFSKERQMMIEIERAEKLIDEYRRNRIDHQAPDIEGLVKKLYEKSEWNDDLQQRYVDYHDAMTIVRDHFPDAGNMVGPSGYPVMGDADECGAEKAAGDGKATCHLSPAQSEITE